MCLGARPIWGYSKALGCPESGVIEILPDHPCHYLAENAYTSIDNYSPYETWLNIAWNPFLVFSLTLLWIRGTCQVIFELVLVIF